MTVIETDKRVVADVCSFCPDGKTPANIRVVDRTGTLRLICTDCEWIVTNHDWQLLTKKVMQYQMNGETRPRWMPKRVWRIKNQRLEYLAASWTVAFATLVGSGLKYKTPIDPKADNND